MYTISAGIADEHRLFREAVIHTMKKDAPRINFVIEASTGRELINKMDHVVPQVLMLDVNMPELDGFKTAAFLRKKFPEVKILVVSSRKDTSTVLRMLDLGVHTYLHKDTSPAQVGEAIREVFKHNYYVTDLMSTAMLQRIATGSDTTKTSFTVREQEVAKLICKELTTAEIAQKLALSPRTVETHRRNMVVKSGVRNTAGLVVYLVKQGYV